MKPKIIKHNETIIAHFFPKELRAENGIQFLTPAEYPLQVGLLEHKDGHHVPPHIHKDLHYNVNTTQEFLYIEKGKNIVVTIYSKDWEEVEKITMSSGDAMLFVSGGHELVIPPGCRIFEIKQGPYPGDKEAKIFKQSE